MVAERKARALLAAGARLDSSARKTPLGSPDFICGAGFELVARQYREGDLKGAALEYSPQRITAK